MNPFDLPGPEFLLFYLVLGGITTGLLVLLRRTQEGQPVASPPLDDPYLIAFLRGGSSEALRVAILSLLDRGLLKPKTVSGTLMVEAKKSAAKKVQRPIEKTVVETAQSPKVAAEVVEELQISLPTQAYEDQLQAMDLLPDEATRNARHVRYGIALALLLAVAGIKILIAFDRGRTNVGFLILLAIGFAVLTYKVAHPFRTTPGDRILADVTNLFGSLSRRAPSLRPGGATSELAFLAAVFGVAAVPESVFPKKHLLLKPKQGPPDWSKDVDLGDIGDIFRSLGDALSSSSCGSSCGGGCGGGCGGCGG